MPLNLAQAYRRTNLTKEQKKQAVAAVYGLQTNSDEVLEMSSRTPLTDEDIEKMRQLVNQHDQAMQAFDLNKPPQKQYRYQEFPRLVYNHDLRTTAKVHNQQQLDAAIAEGYQIEPYPAEVEDGPELDEASAAELAKVEKALAAARKKAKKTGTAPAPVAS